LKERVFREVYIKAGKFWSKNQLTDKHKGGQKMKKIIFAVLTIIMSFMLMGSGSRSVPGPNRAPVAKAGMDKVIARYATIFLDASESYDPDGDKLYYKWELLAAPQNIKPRVFTGQLGMKTCRFRSDILGTYIIALTVYDGKLASERDVIQIRVQDPPGDPNEIVKENDMYIPEPIKMGKMNLRPAPEGTKFIVSPDEFNMSIKLKNPCAWDVQQKISCIYDWTPIKANGKNKKLWEKTITHGPGVETGVRTYTFGPYDSPKEKEFKALAIIREHARGYDVLYTVQLKADN
jgi:hypothetical protein